MALILLIEDEAPIRANLQRFLALEGHAVIEAADGVAGCELARARQPQLILCDVMMPGQDGFAVLRQLRADPLTAAIPFVFLSASAEKSDLEFGLRLGADDYVTKPFKLPDLLAVLRQYLGES